MSNSNNSTEDSNNSRSNPGRPPIQWPTERHIVSEDSRRAAELARSQVRRAQAEGAIHKKQEKVIEPPKESTPEQPEAIEPDQTPQASTPNQEQTMREEPFDWQAYHRAWQQYYHRYFYQYYANWWRQQQPYQAAQQESVAAEPESEDAYKKRIAKEARARIRTTVKTRAKKFQSSSHFKPALAGITVGLTFLLVSYNQIIVGAVKQYVAPGSVVTTPVIVEPNVDGKVSKEPKIIIPKIGVEAPVVYDEPKVDEASYQKALERGVVRLGGTANPGTNGNVVIGGHSSNNVFNPGDYKYVFVNLRRLDVGDVFYLNYKGQRYTYKAFVAKKVIPPTDVSALASTGEPIVTLFTCDPPGTNTNRLIVQAKQIDPDPSAAKKSNE
ncbi:sortase, partial [Candidatus Saccharibacteria bacterium]|nr:sortase [Candidatus Saccharibacteria bacterium]